MHPGSCFPASMQLPRRCPRCERRRQQRIDEVDSRLDRDDLSRFENSGAAQVRVALRPPSLVAFDVAHHTADVVDLQSQEVTDAVRKEHARNAWFQRFLAGCTDDAYFMDDIPQASMRG